MGFRSKKLNEVRAYKIGVSGVLGSGKSSLCRLLAEHFGFHWIETDKIVHALYEAGRPGYQKIKEYFGANFVTKKEVSRSRLRRFVLSSQHKLWILNKLIHPLVFHEVNKKIAHLVKVAPKNETVKICLEAFYFEPDDLGKFIDRLIVVDAADAIIIKRLKDRKIPLQELKTFIHFQRKNLPKGEKIMNDRSRKDLLIRLQYQGINVKF